MAHTGVPATHLRRPASVKTPFTRQLPLRRPALWEGRMRAGEHGLEHAARTVRILADKAVCSIASHLPLAG
jgi:hypothetical protein